MRRVIVIGLLLLLGACANQAPQQRRAFIASLVGKSELDLVRQLGVPTRTFTVDGEKFLAYDDRRVEVLPGYYGAPWGGPGWGPWGWGWGGGWGPPIVLARGCEITFDIREGKVASFTLVGPDC